MSIRRLSVLCSVALLPLLGACEGKSQPGAPAQAQAKPGAPAQGDFQGPAMGVARNEAAPDQPPPAAADDEGGAMAAPPTPEPPTPGATPTPTPTPSLGGPPLADPRWFRKTIFGDKGNAIDTKRTQADAEGRFSSLIRFELAEMDVEACAKHLEEMVKSEVTNVKREVQDNGRIKLDGNTDRYSITFMCGEAQGKTIAYVSYAWT